MVTGSKSRIHRADDGPSTKTRSHAGSPNVLHVIACRSIALGAAILLAALLTRYPPGALWAGIALAGYAALLWYRPQIWMFLVPALLPVLDFSPWVGWIYLRESDFLVLATLAVGYWKIVPQRALRNPTPVAFALLLLLMVSHAISAFLGLGDVPPIDANAFATYQSPYNSIRVVLGFAWAVLLLPLFARSLDDEGSDGVSRYFFPGMVAGLALAGLATLWERLAFPGLLDFASDYRATGSFPEMHVGGAALDGYLMLALPFAAIWAMYNRTLASMVAASLAFGLATYAMLVTFTRSTYFAFSVVLAMVMVGLLVASRQRASSGGAKWLPLVVVLPLLAYVAIQVFATGGYRALAASMGLFAAAYFAGAVKASGRSVMAVVLGALVLGGAMVGMMMLWPRSVYVSYALVAALLGVGLLLFWMDRERKRGVVLAIVSFPLLALGTVLVAWHWGSGAAAWDALIAVALAVGLVAYNRVAAHPVWSLNREHVIVALLLAVALAMMIPVVGNYRMQERFTQVNRDYALRSAHWRDGLNMIEPGWLAGAFGMGIGTFPHHYFWQNRAGEMPGTQTYLTDGGNTFLRIGGPRATIGNGEVLSVFQMVSVQPGKTYRLSFNLRSNGNDVVLLTDICEKWLIYPIACAGWQGLSGTRVDTAGWTRFEKVFPSGGLGQLHWYGKRPAQFTLAVEKAGAYVDIDNVVLADDAGRNLLRNGDFSDSHAWWFFSSDRHHLPWHAKSILIHILFEQGWLGVVAFGLLLFYAMREFMRRVLARDVMAVAPLAAVGGFLVVGAFDSLLDFPRLTLLFYLVVFLGLIPGQARTVAARAPTGASTARRSRAPH